MSEHLIRLRGGWLSVDRDTPADQSRTAAAPMITLPTTWSDQPSSPHGVRLVRKFATPSLDADRDRLALRLNDVEGLVSASLNGVEIARPVPGTSALEVALPRPLAPRNLLVLDVDLALVGTALGPQARPWGAIALVVVSEESPADTPRRAGSRDDSADRPADNGDDLLGGTATRA